MSPLYVVLAAVAALRLAELAFAARNRRRLLARGAREVGAGHYPLFVLLHAGWLASMALVIPAETAPNGPLLALFGALQALRLWVIASLGERWTTRILVLDGAPLVRRGPYRWLRHPNYAIVAAEIVLLPGAFGAWGLAGVFGLLNLALLGYRIRVEERALGLRP